VKSLIVAWLVGEGLMTYKDVQRHQRPPLPAEVLATSGLFVVLGILGESAPKLATTLAWGFDTAAFLSLWAAQPNQGGGKTAAPKTPAKGK